jgi:para-nitrobenzyl esterase
MKETATQALGAGRFADVPLIIGWNSGEDSLMSAPNPTPAARDAFVDRVFGGPARWVAAKASTGKPAWLYHFSYIGGRFRPAMTRAAHAAEIQYVWEYWGRRTPMSVVTEEDKAMASLMHACWVAFAKAGVPSCGGQPWPAYDPAKDQLMEFGASSGVRTHFRKAELDAAQAAVLPTLALGK